MENAVEFHNVSFAYPPAGDEAEGITPVLAETTATLPAGMMSVVGPNGVGKSTLMLLAGARLFPQSGSVHVLGTDTKMFSAVQDDPETETERNRLVSFIYQNMEFETTEAVGDLMGFVYENGFYEDQRQEYLDRITRALELEAFLHKRTQELAKGQLQRAIIAFSLLYGSRLIIMDEPVFALEEPQKDRALEFLRDVSREQNLTIYFSVHNLDLSRKYSDYVVLFLKPGEFMIGETSDVLTRDRLEQAYSAPIDTLYERDKLYREMLVQTLK